MLVRTVVNARLRTAPWKRSGRATLLARRSGFGASVGAAAEADDRDAEVVPFAQLHDWTDVVPGPEDDEVVGRGETVGKGGDPRV